MSMPIIFLIAVFHSVKATSDGASVDEISKDVAQKYLKLLEEEQEYDVDKLSDVRECDNGELEFLTTWKGYVDSTWEKIDCFNGPLSKYCIYSLFSSGSVTPILQNRIPGFTQTGEEAENLAKRYWDDKKDKETSIKVRKITATQTTKIDLLKPAAGKKTTTILMKTVAARHPTKSSSKKSCKEKSITGMESSSTRMTDGGEIHSYHEKPPPNQKACPTRTKKKDSLVIAKKRDRNECNERNDKVREMLCLMCGTISDKNAKLTLKM